MTVQKDCSFIYSVILAFICMGCEYPTEINESQSAIAFVPQFIIENNASTAKTVSLKKAYYYNNAWDIRSEANVENGLPVSVEALPGEDGVLKTKVSMNISVDPSLILSFVLTIDGKHYVGWDAAAGAGALEEIVEYGLGYVSLLPGEIDLDYPETFLGSTLTPKLEEDRLGRTYVAALYGVTITDEGVNFTLYAKE